MPTQQLSSLEKAKNFFINHVESVPFHEFMKIAIDSLNLAEENKVDQALDLYLRACSFRSRKIGFVTRTSLAEDSLSAPVESYFMNRLSAPQGADLNKREIELIDLNPLQKKHYSWLSYYDIFHPALTLNAIDNIFLELMAANYFGQSMPLPIQLEDLKNTGANPYKKKNFSFCYSGIRTGFAYAICPWTGNFIRSQNSFYIAPNYIFYIFKSRDVFIVCSTQIPFSKQFLYLPNQSIVFNLRNSELGSEWARTISVLSHFIKSNEKKIDYYLNSKSKKTVIMTGLIKNIGHHFFNELAGLYRLYESGALNEKIELWVGPYDYYGLIAKISKEEKLVVKNFDDLGKIAACTLSESATIFTPHEYKVSINFADAVKRHSMSLSSLNETELLKRLQEEPAPKIAFTIRLGRRVWLNQNEAIPKIVNKIQEDFGDAIIIIDGMTKTNPEDKNEEDLIKKEFTLAQDIALKCPNPSNVINIVGMKMAEKVRIIDLIDMSISPKGNGLLPNIQWISNKPAVVHGNSLDLPIAKREAALREGVVSPVLVPLDEIVDDTSDKDRLIMNYSVKWEAIYRCIAPLLKELLLAKKINRVD